MDRITLAKLRKLKAQQEKIVALTVYDASFAHLLEQSGVEVLLVGDSLGMVIQGHPTTLPVTLEHMIYHTQAVYRGTQQALLVVDMPFMTYATPKQALRNAARLMREGQAQVVKLEGGEWLAPTIELLTARGIPVCAHLGLLPQSIHQLGGYYVQGRQPAQAQRLQAEAHCLQEAGATLLVLECVPSPLAAAITQSLSIPVIGIGAGPQCDGQILVLYDLLGLTPGKSPSFSKDFLKAARPDSSRLQHAIATYVEDVKNQHFPDLEHSFTS